MADKYCSNCGGKIEPGDKFCQHCGKKVVKESHSVNGLLPFIGIICVVCLFVLLMPLFESNKPAGQNSDNVASNSGGDTPVLNESPKYKYAEITADRIIVRSGPSKSSEGVGYVFEGDEVDVYSSKVADGLTWYETDFGCWVGDDGSWLKMHETDTYTPHPYYPMECLPNTAVGNYVTFGYYEQNGNFNDGAEAIWWRVLANDGKKMLLVSEQALDCKEFDSYFSSWKDSEIRKWLNDEFLKTAFSSSQRQGLMVGKNNTERNNEPQTNDYVFLLSETEVTTYFVGNEDRVCIPTEYAKMMGAEGSYGYCHWWLRTLNGDDRAAVTVRSDGHVMYKGVDVYDNSHGVRPAIWVRIAN